MSGITTLAGLAMLGTAAAIYEDSSMSSWLARELTKENLYEAQEDTTKAWAMLRRGNCAGSLDRMSRVTFNLGMIVARGFTHYHAPGMDKMREKSDAIGRTIDRLETEFVRRCVR